MHDGCPYSEQHCTLPLIFKFLLVIHLVCLVCNF